MTSSTQELLALQSHDTHPKPPDSRDVPQTPFVIEADFISSTWRDFFVLQKSTFSCSGHRP